MREEGAVEDVDQFSINWEGLEDDQLVQQLQARGNDNPFDDYAPDRLHDVPCEPPGCPLTWEQVNELDSELEAEFDVDTLDLVVLMVVWIRALTLCKDIYRVQTFIE
ncbi:hypothetical protein APHAL10511_008628 [Amanita phalloides]|nr:hypothetical protein APHAL10511_008628 [Amanita phalloides]